MAYVRRRRRCDEVRTARRTPSVAANRCATTGNVARSTARRTTATAVIACRCHRRRRRSTWYGCTRSHQHTHTRTQHSHAHGRTCKTHTHARERGAHARTRMSFEQLVRGARKGNNGGAPLLFRVTANAGADPNRRRLGRR